MKGIPIKFRGVNILHTSTMNYGESICGGVLMQCADGRVWLGNETGTYVDPDSISQLCGYDADGNEVYEGDELYYYRCYCVSGDYIRQNKIPKAGVCTVIDAHCLKGLAYVGLNDHFDYEFLLKTKVNAK